MLAPVPIRPPILGSPTLPAPTTSTCFPASFTNIGKRLVTVASSRVSGVPGFADYDGRQIASHRSDSFTCEKLAKLCIGVPRKEAPQIFARLPRSEVLPQQSLDRSRNLGCEAAISHRSCRCLIQAERASDTEVIGIDEAAVDFHLFPVDADVGDPVLAATVRASRDVQLEVLIEAGKTLFQFLNEPTSEALSLRDCELAEFRACAGDGSAIEGGSGHAQTDVIKFFGQRFRVERWNVHDQQVLHVGGSQFAPCEAIGEIGGGVHLIGGHASAQHRRANVGIARLLLRMNAYMVAIHIGRRFFLDRRIEMESDTPLEFVEEAVGGPAMAEEQKLQARPLAMFAQYVGVAEQFRDAF